MDVNIPLWICPEIKDELLSYSFLSFYLTNYYYAHHTPDFFFGIVESNLLPGNINLRIISFNDKPFDSVDHKNSQTIHLWTFYADEPEGLRLLGWIVGYK